METKYAGEIVRTTITLPTAVDDKLDELVFLQRKSTRRTKNDLMLEGIEALLAKYGAGTIESLVREANDKRR